MVIVCPGFGAERDDGGKFCLFRAQPGSLSAQPGHLARQLLSLSDAQAVQDLLQPVHLGMQVTLTGRAPFMPPRTGLRSHGVGEHEVEAFSSLALNALVGFQLTEPASTRRLRLMYEYLIRTLTDSVHESG